jgi:aspartate aminotransferase
VKSTSEYTANLSANSIGQEIFGVLKDETKENLNLWYNSQKNYYKKIMFRLREDLEAQIPGLIISKPQAAIYFIIDFKNIVNEKFDSVLFTKYCAEKGKINIENRYYSILLAPMKLFYQNKELGRTQMRLAVVEPPEKIKLTAEILKNLFIEYKKTIT